MAVLKAIKCTNLPIADSHMAWLSDKNFRKRKWTLLLSATKIQIAIKILICA